MKPIRPAGSISRNRFIYHKAMGLEGIASVRKMSSEWVAKMNNEFDATVGQNSLPLRLENRSIAFLNQMHSQREQEPGELDTHPNEP